MYNAPKMSGYVKNLNEIKYILFLIEDEKLLKAYNKVWNKISNLTQKEFDSKPVYNEIFKN